jgi:hypothetical protein
MVSPPGVGLVPKLDLNRTPSERGAGSPLLLDRQRIAILLPMIAEQIAEDFNRAGFGQL